MRELVSDTLQALVASAPCEQVSDTFSKCTRRSTLSTGCQLAGFQRTAWLYQGSCVTRI